MSHSASEATSQTVLGASYSNARYCNY